MPMDKVTHALGKHIAQRSQTLKDNRQESQTLSLNLGVNRSTKLINGEESPLIPPQLMGPQMININSASIFENNFNNNKAFGNGFYSP